MEAIQITNILYLISAVAFILGIKRLSHPKTARSGNLLSSLGMLIAIIATLTYPGKEFDFTLILAGVGIGAVIGAIFATRVQMTEMPQMVAIFNGLGGAASAFVASSEFLSSPNSPFIIVCLSVFIGSLTFTGSFVAFGKLQGFISGRAVTFKGQQAINAVIALLSVSLILAPGLFFDSSMYSGYLNAFFVIIVLALILGVGLTIPIGGADMPVVISLLNSYSGIAAAATGFLISNNALIISGSLVGASGLILTNIMCKGMNRSLANVIFGAVGAESEGGSSDGKEMNIKSYSTTEAAMILDAAEKIIIVPGYGLAVAQAQHVAREVAESLEAMGKTVLYAIHPVAGRMPGHMNVLLAEANVPYDEVFELEEINNDFANADVAFVIGANDVTNPVAKTDPQSPIYGMPVLDVEKCKSVLFVKRSLSPGYAGIDNDLCYKENTLMLFADAKKMTEDITKNL